MLFIPISLLGFIILARGGDWKEAEVNLFVRVRDYLVLSRIESPRSIPETIKGD